MAGGLSGVRGAVYFPSRSLNTYQTWAEYDRSGVDRDVTAAKGLNLDALRVFLNYEYWDRNPAKARARFDHFFEVAADHDVRILPILFESIGADPTPGRCLDRDLVTATPVRSPSGRTIRNARRWESPREFVRWVVDRYGDHDGLLAIEIMNEPGVVTPRVEFCRAMLRAARRTDSAVPLTMGCRELRFNDQYRDPELDVYQFHCNLPPTEAHMRSALRRAEQVAERTEKPVWLTEWQRTRVEPPDVLLPNYASLASVVRESDLAGDFFWQLMLKPAYLEKQRRRGRINGVFHEDGSVYSGADAAAISGTEGGWQERRAAPDWALGTGR